MKNEETRAATAFFFLHSSFCLHTFPCGALVDERGVAGGLCRRSPIELRGVELVGRSLPRRPNMGLRSNAALPFLESAPEVASKLKEPNTKDEPFADVVKSAQDAAVLVLVY